MRPFFISAALIVLLSAAAFGQTASTTVNYSGTWLLDQSHSKNLPPQYKNIESQRIDVKQELTILNVNAEIKTAGEAEPLRITLNYPLDGTETRTMLPIRTPQGPRSVPTTLSGSISPNGKLRLNIVHQFEANGKTVKGGMTEDWQLGPDGKSILIHLTRDAPQGTIEYDMLFVRQ